MQATTSGATEVDILRYVPQGPSSSSSDAPGWSSSHAGGSGGSLLPPGSHPSQPAPLGPVCWKCKGRSTVPVVKQHEHGERKRCHVCDGRGSLPVRRRLLESRDTPGVITRGRRRPPGWAESGHTPPAVRASLALARERAEENGDSDHSSPKHLALSLLAKANASDDEHSNTKKRADVPVAGPVEGLDWLPSAPGEQLCNLVGRWRILQRVGSHRWTTDDLVTAYCAATALSASFSKVDACGRENGRVINYLDLGTGNASVLQMVSWHILSHGSATGVTDLRGVGVEARSEAVGLACRSLSFNLGNVELNDGTVYTSCGDGGAVRHEVGVVKGDFRDLVALSKEGGGATEGRSESEEEGAMRLVASRRFDLITGTPPYFRVDFKTKKVGGGGTAASDGNVVESAVIRQGAMPTSVQSAPARCEFRGGVEAYCATASSLLSPDGTFVVCENWLNDGRVWDGAERAGLDVTSVLPVVGREGKPTLFAVYTMRKRAGKEMNGQRGGNGDGAQRRGDGVTRTPLVVRDREGRWTVEYSTVLDEMSIPVL